MWCMGLYKRDCKDSEFIKLRHCEQDCENGLRAKQPRRISYTSDEVASLYFLAITHKTQCNNPELIYIRLTLFQ